MTDSMFAELMAVVGMANETNRLATGYQVEIDEQFKSLVQVTGGWGREAEGGWALSRQSRG